METMILSWKVYSFAWDSSDWIPRTWNLLDHSSSSAVWLSREEKVWRPRLINSNGLRSEAWIRNRCGDLAQPTGGDKFARPPAKKGKKTQRQSTSQVDASAAEPRENYRLHGRRLKTGCGPWRKPGKVKAAQGSRLTQTILASYSAAASLRLRSAARARKDLITTESSCSSVE